MTIFHEKYETERSDMLTKSSMCWISEDCSNAIIQPVLFQKTTSEKKKISD